ncbi:IpaC/SipC family type III secretion system effector [Chromobacterium sp. ASV23]|uniref:IpaC/SipC family type III secretion system effector n=1 Tax=Chromobacterium sp. ASV23 TaxID=2795110 RepID=UPI0018EB2950|nr:IpaC/SipC family type III secretion system effector [Chromobacterium sp. ASV23]
MLLTNSHISARVNTHIQAQEGEAKAPIRGDQVDIGDVDTVVEQASVWTAAPEAKMAVPELLPPSADAVEKQASKDWLQKTLKDESFNKVSAMGLKSIKGLAHQASELYDKIFALLLSLELAANKTSQRNTILGSELANLNKDSMYREAGNVLGGSTAGAIVSTSLAAGSLGMSLKGSKIQGDALKQNKVKVDTLTTELKAAKSSLATQGSIKLGSDKVDGVTQITTKPAPGPAQQGAGLPGNAARGVTDTVDGVADNAVKLQPSNKRLDQQQMGALYRPVEEIESDLATQQNAFDTNNLRGRRWEAKGGAMGQTAQAANTITRGGGDYAATVERADQQILQADNRVANTAADESRDDERKLDSLRQEMQRALAGMMQDTAAASGAVASARAS